jgi:hypothetical protein
MGLFCSTSIILLTDQFESYCFMNSTWQRNLVCKCSIELKCISRLVEETENTLVDSWGEENQFLEYSPKNMTSLTNMEVNILKSSNLFH